jgi:hypothetical protein
MLTNLWMAKESLEDHRVEERKIVSERGFILLVETKRLKSLDSSSRACVNGCVDHARDRVRGLASEEDALGDRLPQNFSCIALVVAWSAGLLERDRYDGRPICTTNVRVVVERGEYSVDKVLRHTAGPIAEPGGQAATTAQGPTWRPADC